MPTTDDGGYIREWLLCGPFPGRDLTPEERAPITATGYSQAPFLRGGHLTDYLTPMGGEEAARPNEGDTVESPDGTLLKWQTYVSPTDVVDFEAVFGVPYSEPWPYAFSVLYGYTIFHSPQGGQGYLEVGSDDSAKVHLNGQLVHDAHVRHCTIVIDDIEVTQVEHSPAPPILRRSCSAARVADAPKTDGQVGKSLTGRSEE